MRKIDELIQELCPEGVSLYPLESLVSFNSGIAIKSEDYSESGARVIRISDVQSGRISDKDLKFINVDDFSELHRYQLREGDVVLTMSGSVGRVAQIQSDHLPAILNQRVVALRTINESIDLKFIFYILNQTSFETAATQAGGNGTVVNISTGWIRQFKIAVPPLSVQKEIVSILDTFTDFEAELEDELEARRKQYHFYRESLFSSVDQKLFKPIGDVAACISGATPSSDVAEYWQNGTIPWMSSGEVNKSTVYETGKQISTVGFDSCSTKMVPSGSVVIALAGQGKTRGMVARTRIDLCTNQSLCSIIPGEELLPDYLFFYLKTQYSNLRNISAGEGGRGGLNLNLIKGYKVPVPPIEEQREVVSILERFDQLVESVLEGLPAELSARRKQYEYYRDKLLTFKELAA